MAIRNGANEDETLGSSSRIWEELLEDFRNLERLYREAQSTPGSKAEAEKLEINLFSSLAHVAMHSKVMIETFEGNDEE
ncbi:MAG: hypothetical protein IVW51_05630 [Thermaceae bacterium]|nr:hypothetical protein [Thermaceae bacterium]